MTPFQNSKTFNFNELWKKDRSTSTLLVPAHLINALTLKKNAHGKRISGYLKNLLQMYRTLTYSGMIADPRKIKTEYQDEGLDLKRVSFRPNNADWLELGELALAFGKSRCWVFTFLLEIDLLGLWDMLVEAGLNNAVPTTKNLVLEVFWKLEKFEENFARSYHVKV